MIELTTSLVMLAATFSPVGNTTVVEAQEVPAAEQVSVTQKSGHPITLETYVRDYFADTPILAEISRCESTFRQYNSDGKVLRGKVNSDDIGIMQINKYYHEEDAEKLGFDIYTLEGNLGYAKWLYGKYGDAPWVHSSKCWKQNPKIALK